MTTTQTAPARHTVTARIPNPEPGTFAECPDCGGHLYAWTTPDGTVVHFLCEGDGYACDPLHPCDVYLEHDESWIATPDADGRDALYIVKHDTPEDDDDETTARYFAAAQP